MSEYAALEGGSEVFTTGSTRGLRVWSNRTVLVTGCSGFIGGVVSAALIAAGATVVGLVRNPAKDCYLTLTGLDRHERMLMITGDLLDQEYVHNAIANHSVDAVLHLAGEAILGKDDDADVYVLNTVATGNLLRAIANIRPNAVFVLASTDMVYGPGSRQPFEEAMLPQPHNSYAQSKYEAEMLVARYVEQGDIIAGIIRLSNVYGGGDLNFSRLIPGTIRRVLAGETPMLHSDGRSIRDFIHVDDVVRGFLDFSAALKAGNLNGEVINLAAGRSVRVMDVVTQLLDAAACSERVLKLGPPDLCADVQRYTSIENARRQLHWAPQISLKQGLAQTIDWYENTGFKSTGEI